MRLTNLPAAALLGAALLAPTGTATAAGETCQGQPATIVGTPGGQVVGTEGADVIVTNGATRVDALRGDDLVCATGEGGVVAILGGGDDTYRTNRLGGKASIVKGNAGKDRLEVDLPTRRLNADLGRRITDKQNGSKTLIRGFDDYAVVAKTAKIRGTNRGERIEVVSCKAWVNAGPSKDLIIHSVEYGDGDEMGTPKCGKYRAVVNGGRGHDTIKGTPGNDRLRGNRGRDATDGRGGRDTCDAERRVRCERRI